MAAWLLLLSLSAVLQKGHLTSAHHVAAVIHVSDAQARSSDADQAPSRSASEDHGSGKAPSVWSRFRSALLPGTAPATDASDTLLPRDERASAADVAHLSGSQVRKCFLQFISYVAVSSACCIGGN